MYSSSTRLGQHRVHAAFTLPGARSIAYYLQLVKVLFIAWWNSRMSMRVHEAGAQDGEI